VKAEAFPARSLRLMCQFASQARLHSDPNLQIGLCQIGLIWTQPLPSA
jgi:hypothetical protein